MLLMLDLLACVMWLQEEVCAVLTMEKANVAVNRLLAAQRVHELVCVVVDEAHMVADPSR
jgi:DNA polymerase theta